MRFDRPTILTCAITGNITRPSQSPHLPITPDQIVGSSLDAWRAGAAVVHIHVRAADGTPSMALDLYRMVVDGIRASGSDVIINLTTGPGQRFVPGLDDPKIAGPGTTLTRPEVRVEHVAALRPELCTLDLNTMFSNGSVVINTPGTLTTMAGIVRGAGVVPELELFGPGDLVLARDLAEKGVLPPRNLVQFILGIKYAAPADPLTLSALLAMLPPDWPWAASGIGRMSFPMVALAVLNGGHVRVGLEDNLHLAKGVLAESNAALVDKAVRIVSDLGGRVASPDEARALIGITAA